MTRRCGLALAAGLMVVAILVSAVAASDAARETLHLRVDGMMKSRSGAT